MNNASLMIGKTMIALDGPIGSVDDVYFDDQTWNVRYVVVDTAKWLAGRKVLLVPDAIVTPWHHQPVIAVKLTMEQIRSGPDMDTDMPVTRLAERLLHRHYQWTPYWESMMPIPPMAPPTPGLVEEHRQHVEENPKSPADARLRSANELGGYYVQAGDGEVGHVEDLLVDDDLRRILFLIVKVKDWLFGKKVLAASSLISRVDWDTSTVHVDANCRALKGAQEYNPAA